MSPEQLIEYALAANCTLFHEGSQVAFSCPTNVDCRDCGMWAIESPASKCLFWNKDLVPDALHFKATTILKSTHPEFFV